MKINLAPLRKFTPATRKIWLILLAGAVWLGVGCMLISFASRWIGPLKPLYILAAVLPGLVLAALIYRFGFAPLALKNIRRIGAYRRDRVCLFAFQEWKSYPLVGFMISLGVYLRSYSAVPKPLLAVLYLGIGGGLFLSSLRYFAHSAGLGVARREPSEP